MTTFHKYLLFSQKKVFSYYIIFHNMVLLKLIMWS